MEESGYRMILMAAVCELERSGSIYPGRYYEVLENMGRVFARIFAKIRENSSVPDDFKRPSGSQRKSFWLRRLWELSAFSRIFAYLEGKRISKIGTTRQREDGARAGRRGRTLRFTTPDL